MNYYQDFTLLPDAEISPYFLWQKIYQKLHLALVNIQDAQGNVPIGVAFPAYRGQTDKKPTLGNKLRLFAEQEQQLQQLNLKQTLDDLADYVHLTSIKTIPSKTIETYASYYRIQPKSSDERIQRRKAKYKDADNHPMNQQNQARRVAKYQNISLKEAREYQQKRQQQQHRDEPFIYIKSQSNGQRFRLFIGYQEQQQVKSQGFNTYGLSNTSTVPIFP